MAYSGAAERSSNDRDGASWRLGSTESSRARNSSSDCNVTDIVDDYAMRRHLLHRFVLCAGLRRSAPAFNSCGFSVSISIVDLRSEHSVRRRLKDATVIELASRKL
jgi:hypothetical protein